MRLRVLIICLLLMVTLFGPGLGADAQEGENPLHDAMNRYFESDCEVTVSEEGDFVFSDCTPEEISAVLEEVGISARPETETTCTAIPQWAEAPRYTISADGLEFDGSFPSLELAGSPNFRLIDFYPFVGAMSVSYVWRPTNDILTRTGFGIMYELMGCEEEDSLEMSTGFANVRHGLNNPSDSGLVVLMQDANVIAIEANLDNLPQADVINILTTQHGWSREQVTDAYETWDASH